MISIKDRLVNLLGAWIVCQGDQDKKLILPNVKHEGMPLSAEAKI
jgi:hypothetical protein